MHRLGAQEEPPPACADTALDLQALVQRGLASCGSRADRGAAALGREPVRDGDRLDEGGLAGAVLTDQERDAGREVEPLGEQLRHGGIVRGPLGLGSSSASRARLTLTTGGWLNVHRSQPVRPGVTDRVASVVLVVEAGQPGREPLDRDLEVGVQVDELDEPLGEPGEGDLLVAPRGSAAPRCLDR